MELQQVIADGFGIYRIAQGSGANPWKLELLGGVRFWDVNTRLETSLGEGSGRTVNWADGIGGLRLWLPLTGCLSLVGHGDVGAGGAKLDWSASGDLGFRLSRLLVIGAGYRTLNVDYEKTGDVTTERRRFDISMHGPELWLLFTW